MIDLTNAKFKEVKNIKNKIELELFILGFYYHELGQEMTFVTTRTIPTGRINIYKIHYGIGTDIKKIDQGTHNHINDSLIESFENYAPNEQLNHDFISVPNSKERIMKACGNSSFASWGAYIKNYRPIFFECFIGGNSLILFRISENDSKYELSYKKIKGENNIKGYSLERYGEMLNKIEPLQEKYKEYNSLNGFEGIKNVDNLDGIYSYITNIVKEITGNELNCGYLF